MKIKYFFSLLTVSLLSASLALLLNNKFDTKKDSDSPTEKTITHFTKFEPTTKTATTPLIDFTSAASIATPAVVHVRTTTTPESGVQRGGALDIFREFFGDEYGQQYRGNMPRQATGSGVILSSDGYIVTNNHVVSGADRIEVTLSNNEHMDAELIGTDPSTDMALIKVDHDDLNFLSFGNSDSVVVGQWVLAVGNPFDLESTVTAGIVSAKGRNINLLNGEDGLPAVESFIQTDAAVNPGNSGGALIDVQGRLIGINTAIATPTGTYAGYSFAVPVAIVQKVIGDLLEFGEVQRAFLGVSIDISKNDLGGVYINDVQEGSGAADANLRSGDLLTSINNTAVHSFPELQEQVSKYRPGEYISVEFDRGGKPMQAKILLKNSEQTTQLVHHKSPPASSSEYLDKLGIELTELPTEALHKFDIKNGVEVSTLHDGIVSAQTRISKGFIITSVNTLPVNSVEDVQNALTKNEGNVILEGFYPDYPYKIYNYHLNLR